MKKLSLMLVFVMLFAALSAFGVFAEEAEVTYPFTITKDHVDWEKTTSFATDGGAALSTDGLKSLFDGDVQAGNPGWYSYNARWEGKGTNGKGSTTTIVLKEEYYITSAQLYFWANNNWNPVSIKFYDAKGNLSGSGLAPQAHTAGTALDLDSNFKAKTIVIEYPEINKYAWFYEFVLTVNKAPECTHDMALYMDEYVITTPATCTTPAEITYECQNCGEDITVPAGYVDVTDFSKKDTISTEGAGGSTTNAYSMYDNSMESYLMASGSWYVDSSINLNIPYYISSVTVWTGNSYTTTASQGAYFTFYYKAPNETEWVEAGVKSCPATESDVIYEHTLELATPVYASAVRIVAKGLNSYCGKVYEAQVTGAVDIKAGATGHSWVEGETVAPTCVANGYTNYTCSGCGETKADDFVRETGEHTWADATCEAPKTCTVCNGTEGNALGHNYEPGEKQEDGSVTYTCTNNCGSFYVINNSAVNGEYFLGTDAVVFLDGVLTIMGNQYSYENNLTTGMITITNDETIFFQVIEGKIYHKGAEVLHQHNEETLIVETTDATCTEDGKTVTTCPFCGILSEETIKAEGHIASWSETREYVSATCMTEGYEKDICEVCKEEYTVVFPVDTVFGHREIWGTGVGEDPTCISDGYYSYQCELCEETITTVYPANEDAHVWDQDLHVLVPATCQEGGYSYNKCSLCETEVTEEFGPSEWAHKYDNGFASNGVIVYTCTLCGDSYEEELDPALPYGDITAEIVANDPEYPMMVEPAYYSVSVPGNYVLTIKNEADVYIIYSDKDVLIETSTFEFTLAEGESITFSVMTSDRAAGTVELNLASADNAMLNGTYVTPDGSALFVFADGALTVTDTNEMVPSGFAGVYTYNYNSVTGEVAVDPSTLVLSAGLDMGGNTQIYVFGRMPLKAYVPPMDVVLGDNEITVTNTNYFFDGIKVVFTATEAGTYVITASETGEVIVEGMNGSEIVELPYEVELAEGQAFEFIVTSSANPMMGENDTVVVTIAKKVTHVHVEEIIPAVLPTPSVQGYTAGVKCSDCGETLVAPKAINVTDMADTKDPNFRVAAASLTLMDSIVVNYKSVVTAGYNNPYMVFVFKGEEYMVESSGVEAGTGRLIFDFDKVEAHWMNENIEAYVYAETAEGEYSRNMILEYSVKNYAINQLKKNDAALTTVISDLLVMGAKTQLYTGYKTNELVTDAVEAAGYTLTPTAFAGVDESYNIATPVTGDRTTGTDWKSGTVYLGSRTVLQLKFLTDDVDTLVVKVTVGNKTETYTKEDFDYEASSGRYVVNVDFFSAKQYGEPVVGTFERNGEQVGSTITYSVNAYAYRNANSASGATQDLIKALYVYGQSVEAYFG